MKKILILSFLYENDLCLKEFDLLKSHYNKIIDLYCFPIKYYGVRATETGETRIDEENQIIWLHSDDLTSYDKKLIYKVQDCLKFIEENDIEYDVIVKGNTSSYLNLVLLNKSIQQNHDDAILTGMILYAKKNTSINILARGNCLCLLKKHVECIISSNIEEYTKNVKSYLQDDVYIAYMLIMHEMYYVKSCGNCTIFGEFPNQLLKIDDCLSYMVTTIKNYYIKPDNFSMYTEVDLVLLNTVINYVESRLIFEQKYKGDVLLPTLYVK